MPMNIKLWIAIGAACALALAFAAGHHAASLAYEREIADFKAQAQARYAQALEAKAAREKYLQGKIEDAASKAKASADEIEARYQELLSASWSAAPDADVHFDGADAVGMHADAGGAGGQGGVPATATAPCAVREGASQRAGSDGAKLRKLYEEQLSIARDCDITAAHYNELIEFYEKARQSMQ